MSRVTSASMAPTGPNIAATATARLRMTCASCSHVKPMPPCSWMFFSAHQTKAGRACTAATAAASSNSGVPGSVRAASQTAAVASWAATSMSAAVCFTAWNTPMTRPNCSRTLAYSLAMVTHKCAPPVASAAARTRPSMTAVRRAPREDAVVVRRADELDDPGAAGGVGVAGHRDLDLVAGREHEVVTTRDEEEIGEPGTEDECAAFVGAHRAAHGTVGEAGEERGLLRVGAGGGDDRRRPHRRQEGPGGDRAPERLEHHDQLGEAEAGPAVGLGQVQAQPSEVGHLLPRRRERLLGGVEQGACLGPRAGALEEGGGDARASSRWSSEIAMAMACPPGERVAPT